MTHHTRATIGMLAALLLCGVAAAPAFGAGEDDVRAAAKAYELGHWAEAKLYYERALNADNQVVRAKCGLGWIAAKLGHLAEAEASFRDAVNLSMSRDRRDDPEARAGLGLILIREGRDAEAAHEFPLALAVDPNNWNAYYGQALIALHAEKWDEAKALLDKGAKKRGAAEGEDDYAYGMALYYLGTGKLEEADRAASRALNLDPSDPERTRVMDQIWTKRGAPANGIKAVEQAMAVPGMVAGAPMLDELGRMHEQQHEYDKALENYLSAMKADSVYAPVLFDLADLLRRAKKYEHAARVYLRYRDLEPKDVAALVGLSEACLEIGQNDKALEYAKEAGKISSTRPEVRRAFARAGLRSNERATRANAASIFTALPDSIWTAKDWVSFAEHQCDTKRYEDARGSLKRALALSPDMPEALFQLGVVELGSQNSAQAITLLERAVAAKPEAPAYQLNLGIAYLAQKRNVDAVGAMRKAVKLNGRYTPGRILLAQTLAACDSLPAAEAEYRQAVTADPKNAKALLGLAWCQLRGASYKESVQTYRQATDVEPNNADAWAGLGNAALGAGDLGTAEQALGKAKAIDPENIAMKKGFELLAKARTAAGQKG